MNTILLLYLAIGCIYSGWLFWPEGMRMLQSRTLKDYLFGVMAFALLVICWPLCMFAIFVLGDDEE